MKKVLITSSGIQISIESNQNNSTDNFDYIVNSINSYFECIEEENYINQDVLFETKLIESKSISLYDNNPPKFFFNKNAMN